MRHARECSERIYGCRHCGTRDMTIEESFAHDCPERPRPTLAGVTAALAEVRPRYLVAQAVVTEADGRFLVVVPREAKDRFEGADRRYGTADNRIGDPLLKRGYRLSHSRKGTEVY